jgi:hypothetical protein
MCKPCGGVREKADKNSTSISALLNGSERRLQFGGQLCSLSSRLLRLDLNMKFNIKLSGTYPVRLDEIKLISQKSFDSRSTDPGFCPKTLLKIHQKLAARSEISVGKTFLLP